jgi:hypothetical protein
MAGAGSDGVRKIGVAMDYSPSSKKALDWAISNLLRHGDTLVVVHVLHHGAEEAKHALWAKSGSRKSKPRPSRPNAAVFFFSLLLVQSILADPPSCSADPPLRVPGARGDEAVRRHQRRRGT